MYVHYLEQLAMTQPFRPLLVSLTVRPGHIASPAAVIKENSYSDRNGNFGRKPVGSGPFVFKEWVPGDHVDRHPVGGHEGADAPLGGGR